MPAAHSLGEDRGISVTSYDGYAPPLPSFQNRDLGDLTKHKKKVCICAKMLNKGDAGENM